MNRFEETLRDILLIPLSYTNMTKEEQHEIAMRYVQTYGDILYDQARELIAEETGVEMDRVIINRLYVLKDDFRNFYRGDYFFGIEGEQLQHVRTGEKIPYCGFIRSHFHDTGKEYDAKAFAAADEYLRHFMENLENVEVELNPIKED